MNKDQYLKELKQLLAPLSKVERDEILYDYREHFDNGLRDGKTDLEVINELGSPEEVAENVLEELPNSKKSIHNTNTDLVRMVVLSIVLIFINIIFVLAPLIGIITAYFGLYSVVVTLIFSPMVLFFNAIVNGVGSILISFFLVGVGLSLGVLVLLGLLWLGKWLFRLIKMYINFNVRLVRGY
ncbi:DUF1700 domain-containing protein [Aquisalibacillus elongatus]|uniref:Putative membrane protein n=1 Tax=Aquisalibacillus elongatus TaxID=485577 RepID=A0A3N5C6P7_9BACI|nr:DUF1700 domain-containing protein [Aquisalibacillus elongatus]RPF53985.1 putative membrane protein [Aquisalibacillus elongatus]